ncbi:hypothetical protein DL96DRAFT_628436 [Flagelloscypha sp. PMI_526]|nr:hypothetical protein DL96DRAFT_628436 [Flagelloscypha sp. PMI_526]
MSKTLTVPLNIGATTAPHIYGFLFNYTLLGALLVQVYNYHVYHGVNDSYWMHIMVYLIFAMELLQSGLMGADIYRIFGSGCGDIDVLDINHTDWFGVCILGGIVAAIVQSFYTFRLYKFTKSLLVVGIIGTLIVIQLITAFIQGIMSALLVRYSSLQKRPANLIVWIVELGLLRQTE